MKTRICLLMIIALSLFSFSFAQGARDEKASRPHAYVSPDAIKWQPLIAGVELAVVSGNPSKEGEEFVLRIRAKAGTKIPPHWHPTDEHLTVLKGSLFAGMGEKMEGVVAQEMSAGAYMFLPKNMAHFIIAKEDSEAQVHGTGPFKTIWVKQ
ncbi:MAG: cupin domain-containing protein [Acidobacteriota bacterium]